MHLEDDSYSVVEIVDSYDVHIGEQLAGELGDEGSCILKSLSTEEAVNVVVQYAGCIRDYALHKTQ